MQIPDYLVLYMQTLGGYAGERSREVDQHVRWTNELRSRGSMFIKPPHSRLTSTSQVWWRGEEPRYSVQRGVAAEKVSRELRYRVQSGVVADIVSRVGCGGGPLVT